MPCARPEEPNSRPQACYLSKRDPRVAASSRTNAPFGKSRPGLFSPAAGGALLLTDAWFDVCTSAAGFDRAISLTEAAFVELPLAGAAFWLAVRLTRSRPTDNP